MNRWFNTAGPCQPEMHYMLPSMPRLPQLETLIDRAGYFVLHAPRQVGKTNGTEIRNTRPINLPLGKLFWIFYA
jgi:hypothetical protein